MFCERTQVHCVEPSPRMSALCPEKGLKAAHCLSLKVMRQKSSELAGEIEGWDGGR